MTSTTSKNSTPTTSLLFLLGVDIVEEIPMWLSGTKIILLLVEVDFHCEGGLWKMFGDKAFGKAMPWCEVAFVDGGDEGILYRSEGCCKEVLGEFAFGGIMAENSVGLVRIGAFWWLLSGGAGLQWDVPQDIDPVKQDGDYDLVVF